MEVYLETDGGRLQVIESDGTNLEVTNIQGDNSLVHGGGFDFSNVDISKEVINTLDFSGVKHYTKSFKAQFTLSNRSTESVEFMMRIPNHLEGIPEDKGVFAFMNEGKEVLFQLGPNEEKEFNISAEDFDVLAYYGALEVGSMDGMVYMLYLNAGDGWKEISINHEQEAYELDQEFLIDEMALLLDYDQQIFELERTLAENTALINSLNEALENDGTLPMYSIWKYPDASGIRYYDGSKPIKTYPSVSMPDLITDYPLEEAIVFCRAVVDCEGKTWGMVEISYTHVGLLTGFIEIDALTPVENPDPIESVESLGGFSRGDRIEKFYASFDQDFILLYENGPIYLFPLSSEFVDGYDAPFSGDVSIDVFPNDYFQASLIRTDSPDMPLKCGYKVGDNALEVVEYFRENYEEDDDGYWGEFCFVLGDGERISFRLTNGEELSERIISSIWIHN